MTGEGESGLAPGLATPELASIADFIAQTLPFNALPPALLHGVIEKILIYYHRQGESFDATTPEGGLRILRSGAVDLRDADNKLLDRLGEGESFHIANLNAERGAVVATVIEDALVYLLPDEHYRALREADRDFDRYFSAQRNRRLRRAARYEPEPNAMSREVRSVMGTDLLAVSPAQTIQATARAMSERRVSSAFVVEDDTLLGIVTDRDLRTRCVARGLSLETPVREIMTRDVISVDASENLFDSTLLMTRHGLHHLPVKEGGRTVGIVTTSDLILARQDDPVYLVQHISRQQDVDGIRELLGGVSNLMLQWVNSGMRAREVGRILTAISDAVTVRLIQLAEERLGPAPAPWCWCGFGSQARAEQLLGADQDNGLVIDDSVLDGGVAAGALDWYAQLATFVCDGLAACGYKYCPGGIMATTDSWRQPLREWQDTVRRWAQSPTPDAVMRVSIFFDIRCVYGSHDLAARLQATMLEHSSRNSIFLAALAANVLDTPPPLGIFRRFVVERGGEHRDELDLKKRGVLPVTEIVRLHALAHAITAVNTDERLEALAAGKHLGIANSRNLADALHSVQQLRVRHQCEQVLRGQVPTNFLNPRDLPKMAREQLRDAFTIIDEAQSAVRQTYRAGLG